MGDNRPIGVFDSGVGGLSVFRRIRADLLHENLLYVADSGHAPYGNKSAAFIVRRSFALTEFLLEQGAQPWTELPLWVPESDPAMVQTTGRAAVTAVRSAGLTAPRSLLTPPPLRPASGSPPDGRSRRRSP